MLFPPSVMDTAAINIRVQVFAGAYVFNPPEYIPKSAIARPHDNSIFHLSPTMAAQFYTSTSDA